MVFIIVLFVLQFLVQCALPGRGSRVRAGCVHAGLAELPRQPHRLARLPRPHALLRRRQLRHDSPGTWFSFILEEKKKERMYEKERRQAKERKKEGKQSRKGNKGKEKERKGNKMK